MKEEHRVKFCPLIGVGGKCEITGNPIHDNELWRNCFDAFPRNCFYLRNHLEGTRKLCSQFGKGDCTYAADIGQYKLRNYCLTGGFQQCPNHTMIHEEEVKKQKERKDNYEKLKLKINSTDSEEGLRNLASELRIVNYENSMQLATECEKKANNIAEQKKREERYNQLLSKKRYATSLNSKELNQLDNDFLPSGRLSWQELLQLAVDFRSPPVQGYKDSAELAKECDALATKAKETAYQQLLQAKAQADNKTEPIIVEYRDLAKKFLEFEGRYKDADSLAKECERIAHNQELKIKCNDLIARTPKASTEKDFKELAELFRKLEDYPDAVLQAEECDNLAAKAKASAFDKLLQAKGQADNKTEAIAEYRGLVTRFQEFGTYNGADVLARECAGKAYVQEQKNYYNSLVSRMATAVTEEDFTVLEACFRAMRNYPDAVLRAEECEQKAKPLKYANLISRRHKTVSVTELRELAELFRKLGTYLDSTMQVEECLKEVSHRQTVWASQGLCLNCGGTIGGLFTKKCNVCGRPRDPLGGVANQPLVVCVGCGKQIPAASKFCSGCGRQVAPT